MRRPVIAALALALAAAAAAAPAVAQQAAAGDAEAGRRTYTASCARCHGLNLVSTGLGFDLRTFPRHDPERFRRSVTKGLRAMPAWEGVIGPEQIDNLWAYVGAVNGWNAGPAAASSASAAAR